MEKRAVFRLSELDFLPQGFNDVTLLREVLEWSPESLVTDSGDRIRLFMLPASRDIAIEVIPANPADNVNLQCRKILQRAVQDGLFNQLLTTLEVYKRLRPVMQRIAERAAQFESMNLSLRLSHIAGGDGYAN